VRFIVVTVYINKIAYSYFAPLGNRSLDVNALMFQWPRTNPLLHILDLYVPNPNLCYTASHCSLLWLCLLARNSSKQYATAIVQDSLLLYWHAVPKLHNYKMTVCLEWSFCCHISYSSEVTLMVLDSFILNSWLC